MRNDNEGQTSCEADGHSAYCAGNAEVVCGDCGAIVGDCCCPLCDIGWGYGDEDASR